MSVTHEPVTIEGALLMPGDCTRLESRGLTEEDEPGAVPVRVFPVTDTFG